MATVRKTGTVESIIPLLVEELGAFHRIKVIAARMIQDDYPVVQSFGESCKMKYDDWSSLFTEWRKIRFFRQDQTVSALMSSVERLIFSGGSYESRRVTLSHHYDTILKVCSRFDLSPEEQAAVVQQIINQSEHEPVKLADGDWIFKGFRYTPKGLYSDEQIELLIFEEFDKERKRFERLKQKSDSQDGIAASRSRPRIPERVRIEVWRRDGGKCARCGSRDNLEYDHIVPLSKGGSNTTRNIELLCEKCNRSKGANVA